MSDKKASKKAKPIENLLGMDEEKVMPNVGLKAPRRKGRLAAPTPCPVKMSTDAKVFILSNNLPTNTNTVMLYAVQFCVLHVRDHKVFPSQLAAFDETCFKTPVSKDESEWVKQAAADLECWVEYAYDLIACFKVKPLKIANVASYFAATGSVYRPENDLVALLAWSAGAMPQLDLAGLRMDMAAWNPFVDYHTKAFSSASLVLRFSEAFPLLMKTVFPDVDLDDVKEIDGKSWNLAQSYRLPQSLLGVVSIWVTYTGIISGANRWYQGEKARGLMPRKEVTLWERFFAKEERIGLPVFEDGDTVADMLKKVVEGNFGKAGVEIAIDVNADPEKPDDKQDDNENEGEF